jgi:hypothetical protein
MSNIDFDPISIPENISPGLAPVWSAVVGVSGILSQMLGVMHSLTREEIELQREREETMDLARTTTAFMMVEHMDRAIDVWRTTGSQEKMLAAWKEDFEESFQMSLRNPEVGPKWTAEMIVKFREIVHERMHRIASTNFIQSTWGHIRNPQV